MVSHIISAFSGKPVFGYLGMVYAMLSIGLLGFVVWSQRLAFSWGNSRVINFAICWNSLVSRNTLNSKNFLGYAQSAGNLNFRSFFDKNKYFVINNEDNLKVDKSPSETTRGTSFNFTDFRKTTGKNSCDISDDWLIWFIGFSEGDGALFIGKDWRPIFILTQKETNILYNIHDKLGIGRVRIYGSFGRYRVDDKKGISILITLFNGNLILDKRKAQINKWLNVLNIEEKQTNIWPSFNNSWISGFTDAEGCFNVTLFKRKAMTMGYQVKLRFMIDQKESLNTMLIIKNQLNLFLTHRKSKLGPINMYRVESNSLIKVPLIIAYFSKYNLKTKKQESFNKWVKVYELVKENIHLTEIGLNDIKKISKDINLITSTTRRTGDKLN
jgi:LAGLIDADG endonuclease